MTPSSEIAEKIVSGLGPKHLSDKKYWTPYEHTLAKEIAQAIDQARKEAVFEANKTTMERETNLQKIAVKQAFLKAAEMLRGDVLLAPDEFDSKNKMKVFNMLERIEKAIRAEGDR